MTVCEVVNFFFKEEKKNCRTKTSDSTFVKNFFWLIFFLGNKISISVRTDSLFYLFIPKKSIRFSFFKVSYVQCARNQKNVTFKKLFLCNGGILISTNDFLDSCVNNYLDDILDFTPFPPTLCKVVLIFSHRNRSQIILLKCRTGCRISAFF